MKADPWVTGGVILWLAVGVAAHSTGSLEEYLLGSLIAGLLAWFFSVD